MQIGRTARDGRQGATIILTSKADRGNAELKALCKSKVLTQNQQQDDICLVEGLARSFVLPNPTGRHPKT